MSKLLQSAAFLQGESDADRDVIPFGACRGTGVADELFAGYGKAETDRSLDRLMADVEQSPDWAPSGAEMEAERRHVNSLIDTVARQVPDGCTIRITTETAYHRFHTGRRDDERTWCCTIMLPRRLGSSMFTAVKAADPETAVSESLAKFNESPLALAARQEMAAAEVEEMAESDYGPKAA